LETSYFRLLVTYGDYGSHQAKGGSPRVGTITTTPKPGWPFTLSFSLLAYPPTFRSGPCVTERAAGGAIGTDVAAAALGE
jgi:hypothetical protein